MSKQKRKRRALRQNDQICSKQQRAMINWLITDAPLEARWFDVGDRIDAQQAAKNAENKDAE